MVDAPLGTTSDESLELPFWGGEFGGRGSCVDGLVVFFDCTPKFVGSASVFDTPLTTTSDEDTILPVQAWSDGVLTDAP